MHCAPPQIRLSSISLAIFFVPLLLTLRYSGCAARLHLRDFSLDPFLLFTATDVRSHPPGFFELALRQQLIDLTLAALVVVNVRFWWYVLRSFTPTVTTPSLSYRREGGSSK